LKKRTQKANNLKNVQIEDLVGPDIRKIPKLTESQLHLEDMPSSDMYEKSYMHRDTLDKGIAS